jgi:hypothetical protein
MLSSITFSALGPLTIYADVCLLDDKISSGIDETSIFIGNFINIYFCPNLVDIADNL